jgi:hypothetical protein
LKNIPLFFSLGGGTIFAFILFFFLFLGIKWKGQKSAVISMIIVFLIYLPLAILYWSSIDIFAVHIVFFVMANYGLGVITSIQPMHAPTEEGETTDAWFHIGSAMIISFFLLLTIVDSNTVSSPEKHLADVASQKNYEKERKSNLYQQQLKEQKKRGWKITGGWQHHPRLNQSELFVIHAKNKSGEAIIGADVRLDLFSATDTKKDMQLTLKESSPGIYLRNITLPVDGKWTILITVHKDNNIHEIMRQIEITI